MWKSRRKVAASATVATARKRNHYNNHLSNFQPSDDASSPGCQVVGVTGAAAGWMERRVVTPDGGRSLQRSVYNSVAPGVPLPCLIPLPFPAASVLI